MNRINFVLNTIRKHPDSSKSEIKKLSGLSMEVVLNYIDYLSSNGLIYQSVERSGRIGRKAECYRINPDGAYFIGIKYTAKKFQGAIVNFAGDIVSNYEMRYENRKITPEELIERIDDCIQNLTQKKPISEITAIGVSSPGIVDFEKGDIRVYYGMEGENIHLKSMLEEKYKIPCYVCGTTKAKAISWHLNKKSTPVENYEFIFIGEGCTSAFMYKDKLYSGKNNYDGEFGYVYTFFKDGKRERLGNIIGNGTIVDSLKKQGKNVNDIYDAIALVENGDKQALEIMTKVADSLSYALSFLVTAHASEQIIICGDYVICQYYQQEVKKYLNEYCLPELTEDLDIKFVKNEKLDNAFDAAQLCFYKMFYNEKRT